MFCFINVRRFPNRTVLIKIIDEYIKIGGRNVTYGSDAHNVTELGENIENLSKDNKKLTLTQGIFVNHNFKRI